MPNTLSTMLLATVTAVLITVVTNVVFLPRLDARKRRIQEAHTARDTFNSSLLTIISACARLRNLPLPADGDPACSGVVRARLSAERERWMQQLDDATRWMVDHVETFAAGWPREDLRTMAAQYAVESRMVMLSEQEEDTKIELLTELAAPVQGIFFTYWWNRASNYQADRERLAAALARLNPDPAPAP